MRQNKDLNRAMESENHFLNGLGVISKIYSMKTIILTLFFCALTWNSFSQVYKFKSSLTDIEQGGKIVRSVREVCYHTFDFDNLRVIFEGRNSAGEKVKATYNMKKFYKEGVTYVIVVNEKGMKEIWFSVIANNIGYDFSYGKTRMAFYELTKIR